MLITGRRTWLSIACLSTLLTFPAGDALAFQSGASRPDPAARDAAANLAHPEAAGNRARGGAPGQPQDEYVSGELIVTFKEAAPGAARLNARRQVDGQTVKGFAPIRAELWRLGKGVTVERAIQILTAPGLAGVIEYAEPNYIVHISSPPNDPSRSDLWGLHNIGQTGGKIDADVDALEAWALQTGSSSIVVGIIDTGIDYNHEDLAANIWTNPGESGGGKETNGIDDDGNGYIDDVRGWDFVSDDNDPMDDNGHGTHTAGTIGAVGNNGIGIAGVNWNVQLMPLKFLNSGGSGKTSDAIDAVLYAASFDVRITNNSWGGGRKSRALENAIASSGALFVAAAGNGASSKASYPARYTLDNIISVAATDHSDNLASFSNYSATQVDLGAPGVNTLSTTPGNSYGFKSGTSMATPHVAGVCALIMAQFTGMSNAEVKAQLLNTVDPLSSLAGKTVTGGRLNARAAVGASEFPPDNNPPAAVGDLAVDIAGPTFDTIPLTWTATGDNGISGTAYAYDVRYTSESLNFTPNNPLSDFDGADEVGGWTVTVSDAITADVGTLNGWALHITSASGLTIYEAGDLGLAIPANDPNGVSHTIDVLVGENVLDVNIYLDISHTWVGDLTVIVKHGGTVVTLIDRPGIPASGNGCAADNYAGIILDDEGTGGAIESRCGANLSSIGRAEGEPLPQIYGTPETFEVTGLQPETDYTLSLKVYDEAGNSSVSNFVSESTLTPPPPPPSAWTVEIVDSGSSAGTYNGLDFSASGMPGIAYSNNGQAWFAEWDGFSWQKELLDPDRNTGIDFAYDPAGNPTASYDGGKLYFATRSGTSWSSQVIETKKVNTDNTSLTYDPAGNAAISYRTTGRNGGLKLARRSGGNWITEMVDQGGAARYSALAFDQSRNPGIAFSDVTGGGSSLNTLRYAHFNGSTWDVEDVDIGTSGYGVFAALAYDPITGFPAMLHDGGNTTRFVYWDGSTWHVQALETEATFVSGCALTFGSDGTAYAAWAGDSQLKMATIAPGFATWEIEDIDPEPASPFHLSLKLDPSGALTISYRGSGSTLRYARKGGGDFSGTTCYADCDQSNGTGVLDIFDFLCFQNSFVAGEPYACDCDTSTGPLVCDIFDFLCFQNAFVGGCP